MDCAAGISELSAKVAGVPRSINSPFSSLSPSPSGRSPTPAFDCPLGGSSGSKRSLIRSISPMRGGTPSIARVSRAASRSIAGGGAAATAAFDGELEETDWADSEPWKKYTEKPSQTPSSSREFTLSRGEGLLLKAPNGNIPGVALDPHQGKHSPIPAAFGVYSGGRGSQFLPEHCTERALGDLFNVLCQSGKLSFLESIPTTVASPPKVLHIDVSRTEYAAYGTIHFETHYDQNIWWAHFYPENNQGKKKK